MPFNFIAANALAVTRDTGVAHPPRKEGTVFLDGDKGAVSGVDPVVSGACWGFAFVPTTTI